LRFKDRGSLVAREEEILGEGYTRDESRLCVIYYRPRHPNRELRRIVNLTKRIFVAFYKNCGPHYHFRESVARRFIREFYVPNVSAEPGQIDDFFSVAEVQAYSMQELVFYIASTCDLNVSIWNQKDEMFFRTTDDINSLLTFVASSSVSSAEFDHSILFQDIAFRNAFTTVCIKKESNLWYLFKWQYILWDCDFF
jgi:hypothetical protein